MFNKNFYPTDIGVIALMLSGCNIEGKVFLEPEGGKGDIVDYLYNHGAKDVISCEIEPDLKKILQTKCRVIADDFLTVTRDMVSHIDCIVMNPPFDADEKHIQHAFEIAPAGCWIYALCNLNTLKNPHFKSREQLLQTIKENGRWEALGQVFQTAQRKTDVEIALIVMQKPGQSYETEFEGFFTEDEPEQEQVNGLMSYNVVRDLVNRYIAAVKLFDEQLGIGIRMNALLKGFYGEQLTFSCTEKGQPKLRNEFKISMQIEGWKFIFEKMNLTKYATTSMKEDINKFIQQQQQIPFTMKNIYHMIDIVIGTASQQMDKALLNVFDKITEHHHENRHAVEGWKTNSHYLVGKKFILPGMCYQDQRWYKGSKIEVGYGGNFNLIEDLLKALCYINGDRYDTLGDLRQTMQYRWKVVTDDGITYHQEYNGNHSVQKRIDELYKTGTAHKVIDQYCQYGEWFDFAYFRCKCFKKGSMHFEFTDLELWGKFNQRISKLKGYPLFEGKKETAYQRRNAGKAKAQTLFT